MGDPIVIDAPELQTYGELFLFRSLTLFLWLMWTYLWLPVIHFGSQALGIAGDYQSFVIRGYESLAQVAIPYTLTVAGMGGSLLLWASYNFLRFRGVDRRQPRPPLARESLAEDYGVAPEDLAFWQQSRRLVISHLESGRIASITAR